ncbi:MAG: glycosyltransferase family 39 protein [Pirellulales bacterium]|nr:glycosyltransferase family 39 protein [Pirellulales bacterium]
MPTARARALLLAVLVVAAFAPRLAMHQIRQVVCTDAPFFIERAEAFERGDYAAGLSRLGLNPYPLVLAGLHHAGLDWETAGRLWSLAFATLAVLPLFGFTRRLFGERAAVVACLLYAVQPELIEWSPEIIRDPTFWFLLLATLYFGHVAASAERYTLALYAIVGSCLTLAGLIRFEGWFLVVPLLWWAIAHRTARATWPAVAARIGVAAAMTPLWLVAINVCCFPGHHRWEWGRFDHLAMAVNWTFGAETATPAQGTHVSDNGATATKPGARVPLSTENFTPEDASKRPSLKVMCWGMAHTFLQGVHPLYVLAMGVGLWAVRRQHFLRDQLPLWMLAAVNLGAVWIYFWTHHEITSRYMLLIVLVGLPYAGGGVVWLAEQGARLARTAPVARRAVLVGTVLLVAAIGAIGCTDALTSEYRSRHLKADLGRWIRHYYGEDRTVLCSENLERLVGYYAQARHQGISSDASPREALGRVAEVEPDVVALWLQQPSEQALLAHFEQQESAHYQIYRGSTLPAGCEDVAVLVRTNLPVRQRVVESAAAGVSLSDQARPLY